MSSSQKGGAIYCPPRLINCDAQSVSLFCGSNALLRTAHASVFKPFSPVESRSQDKGAVRCVRPTSQTECVKTKLGGAGGRFGDYLCAEVEPLNVGRNFALRYNAVN